MIEFKPLISFCYFMRNTAYVQGVFRGHHVSPTYHMYVICSIIIHVGLALIDDASCGLYRG